MTPGAYRFREPIHALGIQAGDSLVVTPDGSASIIRLIPEPVAAALASIAEPVHLEQRTALAVVR